ncbi:MAG: hypothetical protein AB1626_01750 [Candidatus Micrarchaeota archaeon]
MRRDAEKIARKIVALFGERYSILLGIDVDSGDSKEAFKWLLAAVLYSAPIRESSATKTYRVFEREKVLSPKKILETGWEGLVGMLDEGTYTRYDFKTADKLLELAKNLERNWGGDLNRLRAASKTRQGLEANLKVLAKGIGNATVSVFLREMRVAWKTAPAPTQLESLAAKKLGLAPIEELEEKLRKKGWRERQFIALETGLMRLGRDFFRKGRPSPL